MRQVKRAGTLVGLMVLIATALFLLLPTPTQTQVLNVLLTGTTLQETSWEFTARQTFYGGMDPGPKGIVVLAADQHGQTMENFVALTDEYQIPITFWISRGTPQVGGALTDEQLQAMHANPLIEVGNHSSYHITNQTYSAGFIRGSQSTVYGFGRTNWVSADSYAPAANDLINIFGAGGWNLIDSVVNDAKLTLNRDNPGWSSRHNYVVDAGTIEGIVTCDGSAVVTYDEADWPDATDPPPSHLGAPVWGGTMKGGVLYIADEVVAGEGDPIFFVMNTDDDADTITLNRTCDDVGGSTVYLAMGLDSFGNSLAEANQYLRDDIGDQTFQATSYGGPGNAIQVHKALMAAARGVENMVASTPVGTSGFNAYSTMSRWSVHRAGNGSATMRYLMTPQELRNVAQAAMDGHSMFVNNLEGYLPHADFAPSGETIVLTDNDATVTCDNPDCGWQLDGDVAADDWLIIDSPSITKAYQISAVTDDEFLELTENAELSLSGASFWIVDDPATSPEAYMVYETLETFYSFLNDNRDKVLALKMSDAVNYMARYADLNFNLIQNPYYRVVGSVPQVSSNGAARCGGADDLCIGEANSVAYAPWRFLNGGDYCTTDLDGDGIHNEAGEVSAGGDQRGGQNVLHCDTGGGAVSFQLMQAVPVNRNTDYIMQAAIEVVELDANPTTFVIDVTGAQGALAGANSDSNIYCNDQTELTNEFGDPTKQTYYSLCRFSTKDLGLAAGHVNCDELGDACTLEWSIGMSDYTANPSVIIQREAEGIIEVQPPPHYYETFPIVTPTADDRVCGITTSAGANYNTLSSSLASIAFWVSCRNASTNALTDTDFMFHWPVAPVRGAGNSSMLNRESFDVRFRINVNGEFYIRPVVLLEDRGFVDPY